MTRFVRALLGLALFALCVPVASAQEGTPAECSDFQVYWEALVGTVPDDPAGLEAFYTLVDAGPRTVLTEEDQTLALGFMQAWARNIESLDAALIPDSARVWHDELISDIDMTASIVEYTELTDLADTFTFWSVGTYILLIEEVDTPARCA